MDREINHSSKNFSTLSIAHATKTNKLQWCFLIQKWLRKEWKLESACSSIINAFIRTWICGADAECNKLSLWFVVGEFFLFFTKTSALDIYSLRIGRMAFNLTKVNCVYLQVKKTPSQTVAHQAHYNCGLSAFSLPVAWKIVTVFCNFIIKFRWKT